MIVFIAEHPILTAQILPPYITTTPEEFYGNTTIIRKRVTLPLITDGYQYVGFQNVTRLNSNLIPYNVVMSLGHCGMAKTQELTNLLCIPPVAHMAPIVKIQIYKISGTEL